MSCAHWWKQKQKCGAVHGAQRRQGTQKKKKCKVKKKKNVMYAKALCAGSRLEQRKKRGRGKEGFAAG